MPHASFKIIPGVDQNKTPALNEAAISESQLIRFVPDRTLGGIVQKLGGWLKYFSSSIRSKVRCLWAWKDLAGNSYLGVGAEGIAPIVVTGASGTGTTVTLTYTGPFTFVAGYSIQVTGMNPSAYNGTYTVTASTSTSVSFASTTTTAFVSGGSITGAGNSLVVITNGGANDITPQTRTVDVAVNFSTTAGSNQVLVVDTGRSVDDYDVVDIQTHISVGGIILFGQYQIYNPGLGPNQYYIYPKNTFDESYLATSTVANGGSVALYTLTTGSDFVNVTLPAHGYLEGQEYAILVATSYAGITLLGAYVITSIVDANNFVISASTTASTINVTGASGTGVTATLTYSGSTIPIGSTIVVSGVVPAGYNGTHVVTASGVGTVSYANATTAAYVSGGTIRGSFRISENSGNVRFKYWNGIGPLPAGTGYGIGGYGRGAYGSGIPQVAGSGIPINATDWTLDNWGEELISTPLNGPIFKWSPTSGDPIALAIPEAPSVNQGAFVAMPQRQIISWGTTFNGIADPMLIRWCDVNNYNSWTALITNQAGSYRVPKGSKIIQCIQGPQQGLIWTDLSLWAMQYVGPPYVYQFNEVGVNCGLIGRKAAGSMNGIIYWMGQSQFFKFSGSGVEPIRCPIWDVVFQDLDTDNLDKIRVATNSRFGEVAWYYPTTSNGGEVSHYVKYNINLDQWDYGTLGRTAWINESVLGPPIGAGTDNYIYQHEVSPDADEQPMTSYFQTGYFVLNEADLKMFIDQVWPDMKWGYYGNVQSANVLLTFYVLDYPNSTPSVYGPYTMTSAVQFITPRFRGRLVSIRIESNDIGSWWRLGNIRYRVQQDGKF
jgi:hypothetical protein